MIHRSSLVILLMLLVALIVPSSVAQAQNPCGDAYVVTWGDTLYRIAQRCNTSVSALLNANPQIPSRNLIYPGMVLTIPTGTQPQGNLTISPTQGVPGTLVNLNATGFPPNTGVNIGFGRVNSEYDVIAAGITNSSGALTASVQVPPFATPDDQWVFVVSGGGVEAVSSVFDVTSPTTSTCGESYTVQRGDTLYRIAQRCNVALDRLLAANPNIVNRSLIYPGQVLSIPGEGQTVFEQTSIYLIAIGDAGRSGIAIGCDDSAIPVTINIEPTVAPLTAALENLLAIDQQFYGQSGLYNALYQSNLTLDDVIIRDNQAFVYLSGQLMQGGVCDSPRIAAQLEQTALQYRTVDAVAVFLNGQPLENFLTGQ